MTLVPVDPTNALAVSDYLTKARDWLATAVERTGPSEIANARAEIATAAEATKQLGLSKDIQEQAKEMVRRAEWTLEQAIKKDRDAGLLKSQSNGGGLHLPGIRGSLPRSASDRDDLPSSKDFFGSAGERSEVYQLGQATQVEFEAALVAARAEGNLSRANVVRKVKGQGSDQPVTRQQRADLIADLAEQGYTSHQMADKVGVLAPRVREIARAYDIDIAADRMVGKQRRIDYTAAVESAVTSLDNWASSLSFIDFAEVDDSDAADWVASLEESKARLAAFISALKKRTARADTRAVRTTHTGATHV